MAPQMKIFERRSRAVATSVRIAGHRTQDWPLRVSNMTQLMLSRMVRVWQSRGPLKTSSVGKLSNYLLLPAVLYTDSASHASIMAVFGLWVGGHFWLRGLQSRLTAFFITFVAVRLALGCVTIHWHQQQHQGLGCVTIHWHQQHHQGLGCVTIHWHQPKYQGLGCVPHSILTPRLELCHTAHWHQWEHQGLGCITTHWHQQEHQGLGCVTQHTDTSKNTKAWAMLHITLAPATTPRLGLSPSTLTGRLGLCYTPHWHQQQHQGLGCVIQQTDTSNSKAWAVTIHWHQQEHQGLGYVTAH